MNNSDDAIAMPKFYNFLTLLLSLSRWMIGCCLFFLLACNTTNGNLSKEANPNFSLDNISYSVWMAESEMKRNPDPRLLDFRETPKWEYSNGLVCSAMLKVWESTGNQKYLNYVNYYLDSMIPEDGSIKTYDILDYNIDRVNSGKCLMEVYKIDQKPKYKAAIEILRDQMRTHPRTTEGGFWHKKIYNSQMWLDGLYMGSPFLAQYAKEFNEPQLFDDVANQFYLIDKYAYDSTAQLYYHGWDESHAQQWADPVTGQSPEFWGRAMGWFAMALVDVLDFIPEDHAKRQDIIKILNKVVVGIARYQDQTTGLWWQILDKGSKEGNYLESSCSSMFVYSLIKAVNNGYIDQSYWATAQKGYEGILKEFIVENEDGTVSLTKNCAVAGLGGKPYRPGTYEYYVSEPIRDNDPKGIGPFIMAAVLYEKTIKTAL